MMQSEKSKLTEEVVRILDNRTQGQMPSETELQV